MDEHERQIYAPDPEISKVDMLVTIPAEIVKAKLAIMKDLHGGIKETGVNDFHKYVYASGFDVLKAVTPLMAEHGLALEMSPQKPTGPDEHGNMSVLFLMQWQHESGVVSGFIPWYGLAQDRDSKGRMGDKWFNKCATSAEKYFLLKQFHIPSDKDVDADADKGPPKDRPEGQEKPKREGPAPQYQIMRAGDGAMQSYPRTGRGALEAVKFLEDLVLEDADNWQANRTLALTIASSKAGKLAEEGGDTVQKRLAELMELVEGTQNILDAG